MICHHYHPHDDGPLPTANEAWMLQEVKDVLLRDSRLFVLGFMGSFRQNGGRGRIRNGNSVRKTIN